MGGKLHEIARINKAKDHTHEGWESSPCRVMHDGWRGKLIWHAASLKLAAPSGQYILYPSAISSISERDQESVWLSKNIHRGMVEPAGLSTYVCHNTEAWQSRSESVRYSVRNSSMEGCYLPLVEPD